MRTKGEILRELQEHRVNIVKAMKDLAEEEGISTEFAAGPAQYALLMQVTNLEVMMDIRDELAGLRTFLNAIKEEGFFH